MPFSQADRIALSFNILNSVVKSNNVKAAQAGIAKLQAQNQAADNVNKNLFDPIHALILEYQNEFKYLDGNLRSTFAESDLINSAGKTIQNFFYPNVPTIAVPPLSSVGNVWSQTVPFALTYAIGKNYMAVYDTFASEVTFITAVQTVIATPGHTTPQIQAAVNNLIPIVQAEVALIPTDDPNTGNQIQNNTAISNANTFLSNLNSWQSSGVPFLSSALTTRLTFITSRIAHLTTVLGTITQNIMTGAITASSGLYGDRYVYLNIRLDALTGTLTQVVAANGAASAQNSIIASLASQVAIYQTKLPTTPLSANGNGTSLITVMDPSKYAAGDIVFVMADGQDELQFGVKSISGNAITLSDIVPSKYTILNNLRLYKDLT